MSLNALTVLVFSRNHNNILFLVQLDLKNPIWLLFDNQSSLFVKCLHRRMLLQHSYYFDNK